MIIHKLCISLRLILSVAFITLYSAVSVALAPNHFAQNSRLASGRWVKIAIAETGVYEITYEQLQEMGFSNPQAVAMFGSLGTGVNEVLTDNLPDDLQPVAVKHVDGKMLFYGVGARRLVQGVRSGHNTFVRQFSPYDQYAHYFLTQEESPLPVTTVANVESQFEVPYTTSRNFFYHEEEISQPAHSGKQFLGEDFVDAGELTLTANLPRRVANSAVVFTVSAASHSSERATLRCSYDGKNIDLGTTANIPVRENDYSSVEITRLIEPANANENPAINVGISGAGTFSVRALDFLILSYAQHNLLQDEQMPLFFENYNATDGVIVTTGQSAITLWSVNSNGLPSEILPIKEEPVDTERECYYAPDLSGKVELVAFNPESAQKHILSYEEVANQNLHATATPNMVIITTQALAEAANRLAQFHRDHDGFTVEVVDQELLFNEFSSGNRDAMAYRLFLKMLYDRNPETLKYLVLMGGGSYDNREISIKMDSWLLTYQSEVSGEPLQSFISEDFFVSLADGSGAMPTADQPTIAVGRILANTLDEANVGVDKAINYATDNDFGAWRNNMLILGGRGNNYLHIFQAQGVQEHVNKNTISPGLAVQKILQEAFETDDVAKSVFTNALKTGVSLMTFMGHGQPNNIAQLWGGSDVAKTNYAHQPIVSLASCEVARFDNGDVGLGEHMMLNPNGGASALVATARTVIAEENDPLNRAFYEALFKRKADGTAHSIGEALNIAKAQYGTSSNRNKTCFMIFGDPSLTPKLPENKLKITSVAGHEFTAENDTLDLHPLTQIAVKGVIAGADGSVDTSFNGEAIVSLYDRTVFFATAKAGITTRDIYYSPSLLQRVTTEVTNGAFEVLMAVPRECAAVNEAVQIKAIACRENSMEMANGVEGRLRLAPYDHEHATIIDNEPPVIVSLFADSPESLTDATVSANCMIHAEVTDNVALSTQDAVIGRKVRINIDGTVQEMLDVECFLNVTENGAKMVIDYPLTGLADGRHTVALRVADVAGNVASQEISFYVNSAISADLSAENDVTSGEVDFILDTDNDNATCKVEITDVEGNVVWLSEPTKGNVHWDLRNVAGERVPSGVYHYSSVVAVGDAHCATPLKRIVVTKQF